MTVHQCNIPVTIADNGDENIQDSQVPPHPFVLTLQEGQEHELEYMVPPHEPVLSLKKELIKIILLELVLFQVPIILVLLVVQQYYITFFEILNRNPVSFVLKRLGLQTMETVGYFFVTAAELWIHLISYFLNVLNHVVPFDLKLQNYQSIYLVSITMLLLFTVNWSLPFVTVGKRVQNDKQKVKRLKVIVRWLGHSFLIMTVGLYVYTFMNYPKPKLSWLIDPIHMIVINNWYTFLIAIMLAVNVLDFFWIGREKLLISSFLKFKCIPCKWVLEWMAKTWFTIRDKLVPTWISMKWILMIVVMYLPSITGRLFNFAIYSEISYDFYLGLPLAEAVILTMCVASHEEMRQLRGAKNIALSAASLALAGMLFHCSVYGSDLIEIAMGIFKGVGMWTGHLGMAKLYV